LASAPRDRARLLGSETGATGLILETGSHNGPAKGLYEALGWALDGTDHYELLV